MGKIIEYIVPEKEMLKKSKYIITLDPEEVDHEGIKQINAIDFLTGRVDL